MKTTIQTNGNEVIIRLEGRLDTSTSPAVSAEIDSQLSAFSFTESEGASLSVDASQLEYISSSGLRILLSLAKRCTNFRIKDALPQVYEVLDTTGFTKIMTVERAIRQLSVDGCPMIGAGGVGKVYRLDGDTIIKVFREGTTMDEVRREIPMWNEAFVLGMPTAISFDVVRVMPSSESDAECYGLVYELLRAETLSVVVKNHPESLDTYARKYAELFRQLHGIEVSQGGNVPSAIKTVRQQVEHIRRYFPQEKTDMLLHIIDSVPDGNRLLHMDLQTKNAMMQGDELMLIDMGELTRGVPIYDLASIYRDLMVGSKSDPETTARSIGMSPELCMEVGQKFFAMYSGMTDPVQLEQYMKMIGLVFAFNVVLLIPDCPEAAQRGSAIVENLMRPVVMPNADTLKYILSK